MTSAFSFGVGHEFLVPLLDDSAPLPTIGDTPIPLFAATDLALHIGGPGLLFRMLGRVGVRVWRQQASFTAGWQTGGPVEVTKEQDASGADFANRVSLYGFVFGPDVGIIWRSESSVGPSARQRRRCRYGKV